MVGEFGTWGGKDRERPSLTHRSPQNHCSSRSILTLRDPSPPEELIFRSTEQPLVPKNLYWDGRPGCFGRRMVKDRDTGTRSQPAIPGRDKNPLPSLGGAGWAFHYIALRQGKPSGGEGHTFAITPRSRRSPKGQKVVFSGWDEHLRVAPSSSKDLGGLHLGLETKGLLAQVMFFGG